MSDALPREASPIKKRYGTCRTRSTCSNRLRILQSELRNSIAGAPGNEEIVQSKEPPPATNLSCANCGIPFPNRKGIGLHRYSLKSLNVTLDILRQKGAYVCAPCRKFFNSRKSADLNDLLLSSLEQETLHTQQGGNDSSSDDENTDQRDRTAVQSPVYLPDRAPQTPQRDHNYSIKTGTALTPRIVRVHVTPKKVVCTPQSKRKQKRSYSSPLQNTPKRSNQSRHRDRLTFKQPAISLIQRSKYEKALKVMYKSPNRSVKKALRQLMSCAVKDEVKAALSLKYSALSDTFDMGHLSNFDWHSCITALKSSMPVTVAALQSLFPDAAMVSRLTTVGKKGSKRYDMTCSSSLPLPICLYIKLLRNSAIVAC